MLNLFRFVGLRHLMMRPTRTVLTTMGVSLGIALYVAIEIINRSTLASFRESVDAVAGKATLSVTAGDSGFPEEKYEAIRKVQGVKSAVPMIESRAYFAGGTRGVREAKTLMVLGVDLLKEQAVRTYKTTDEEIIDDPLTFLNQPDSIIVTHAFARANGMKIDSAFELATTTGKQKFTVRGLLSPDGPAKAYGGSIAIMDIDGARMMFGKEGKLDRVDVVTAPGEDIPAVRERLSAALGAGYVVERPEGQSAGMERMVKSFQGMLQFFSTLALLVGLFLVMNSVSMAVAERKREIGTLRAMGATRASVLALFLSEALAMGALGAFAGAWLGRGLASLMVNMVTGAMSSQYLTPVTVTRLAFGPGQVGKAVLIGVVASFAAALWPSLRASTIQPLEAMRQRETGAKGEGPSLFRLAPWIGVFMLTFLLVASYFDWGNRSMVVDRICQAFAMLGSALVSPTLVGWLLRAARPVALRCGGTVIRLAQDNLLRNPRRTGSNVMSLLVGLILVIMIASVNTSFQRSIQSWFGRILQADLLVSSNGRLISYQVQPLDEGLGRELAKVPGVRVDPQGGVGVLRFLHVNFEGRQLGMKTFDEFHPDAHYAAFDLKDRPVAEAGPEFFAAKDPVVFVSENFVMHYGKRTGDRIQLDTPSGRIAFRIIGVVTDFANDQGIFYMPRNTFKRLWKDPLVSAFLVSVLKGHDPARVREEIDRRFGQSQNVMTTSNAEIREQMNHIIDENFMFTHAIEAAALLVGLLGLLNTLLISVMERTRELGLLRAVGMARSQVFRMILQESVLQGGLGAVCAVVLGSGIAYLWVTNSLAHILGWMITYHFPWKAIGTTVGLGVLVALIAGMYPSKRAADLEIREALEYE